MHLRDFKLGHPRAEAEGLQFRDEARAKKLSEVIRKLAPKQPIRLIHICGTHEQAIARHGLRSLLPNNLEVVMGPGCPVCVTSVPEVEEAIALARAGKTVLTFGDMYRVPTAGRSLEDVKGEGRDVRIIYSASEAVELAGKLEGEVVFFASGFETTAVTTASIILGGPPENLSILSAHKYVPPAMEALAQMPDTRFDGFLAAGHAATITGYGIFEELADRYGIPVVVAGFEPLDILYALAKMLVIIRDGRPRVENAYPRSVTAEGNITAKEKLFRVFELVEGEWRGIAHFPKSNFEIREKYSKWNARKRFEIKMGRLESATYEAHPECICGKIMAGKASPAECALFGKECTPRDPVGACMVSSEGTCKVWYQYGEGGKL